MPVSHTFVSSKPAAADPTQVGSVEWNATHTISIVDADVSATAAIAQSKLSIASAASGVTGLLTGTDWDTFNGKQSALTFPLASTLGGTGINNAGTLTNASNTTITGGGTIALGGFTLTIPATGTAALLGTAQTFTEVNKFTETTSLKTNGIVISGAGGNLGNFQVYDESATTTTSFYFGTNRTFGSGAVWSSSGWYAARKAGNFQINNDNFVFYQFPANSVSPDKVFTIGDSGNVYIGSSTPVSGVKLYVDGSIRVAKDVWNTSTDAKNRFYFGNNSTTYFGSQAGYIFRSASDTVDLLTISDAGLITQIATTTTTNAVMETARLQAIVSTASTGSANGFGTGLTLYAETATNATNQQQALIASSWIDATNASRKAKLSLSAYDTAARLGLAIEASGTAVKLGFFGGTTAVQQALNAYTSDGEGAAYTGIDNAQAGTVYATVADLNQLRVAYETLRASYDDLRTKLQTSTIVA